MPINIFRKPPPPHIPYKTAMIYPPQPQAILINPLLYNRVSEKSGVTLRMIQQYEQRAKDINKATASNLFVLAQTLGCKAEDLLE